MSCHVAQIICHDISGLGWIYNITFFFKMFLTRTDTCGRYPQGFSVYPFWPCFHYCFVPIKLHQSHLLIWSKLARTPLSNPCSCGFIDVGAIDIRSSNHFWKQHVCIVGCYLGKCQYISQIHDYRFSHFICQLFDVHFLPLFWYGHSSAF